MRSAQRQTWPQFANTARDTPSTVLSKSASANTIAAFLPPSSNETAFTSAAAARMIALPVLVSPVKVIALMPRSEEHTSELQSQSNLVCRLLLEKKNKKNKRS